MAEYFDREGQPMDTLGWAARFEDDAYKRVAHDVLGDVEISTVWLGLNHQWGKGPPLIFETMIFGGEHDESQWRYSTEDEARAGHVRAVRLVDKKEVHQ